jgi:hypothetical protein
VYNLSLKRKSLETQNENYITEKLILATGSNPKIWEMLQRMVMPS